MMKLAKIRNNDIAWTLTRVNMIRTIPMLIIVASLIYTLS